MEVEEEEGKAGQALTVARRLNKGKKDENNNERRVSRRNQGRLSSE